VISFVHAVTTDQGLASTSTPDAGVEAIDFG
jgi:hypothetical protein